MKNFSELLATEQKILLSVELDGIFDNGHPGVTVQVNDSIVEYLHFQEAAKHNFDLALLDPITIKITMSDKQYSQHAETAVLIKSIKIDGFEIVPNWSHLATYKSERGPQGPTSYLGFNGTWQLSMDRPFYQWKHDVTGQGWLLQPI